MALNIPSSSICYKFQWSAQFIADAQFLSGFASIGQVEKAVRFGICCRKYAGGSVTTFSCFVNGKLLGLSVETVTCIFNNRPNGPLVLWKMAGMSSDNWQHFVAVQHALSSISITNDAVITFRIYATGSDSFDVSHGAALWTADKRTTDFYFKVDDQSFHVHKFILAARSPVFRAMLSTDMIESRNGYVTIEDADPEIFRQFLYFVYTGQLDGPASPELGIVADKYDVKNLSDICQVSSSTVDDREELFKVLDRVLPKLPPVLKTNADNMG